MGTPARDTRHDDAEDAYDRTLVALLPAQGDWSEDEYLWLTSRSNRLIEFSAGRIEVLPMPTEQHQAILSMLFLAFPSFVQQAGGKVFFAPLRLRLRAGIYREPDLLLLRSADDPRRHNDYWEGADLVLEVVSPSNARRDLVQKRREYAQAGIPEYWIVNPQTETISVLRLEGGRYRAHGSFGRGATATSALLEGFALSVNAVFDAA